MVRQFALCAILCSRLAGQTGPVSKPVQAVPLQQKIALLEKRVHDLEKGTSVATGPSDSAGRIVSLEAKVKALETQLRFDEFLLQRKQDRADTVQLDPSSRDFVRIDSDSSSFLVLVEDVTPFLDGYRIKLKIGNLSDADFPNARAKIRWSKSFDWKTYSESAYANWQKAVREKETTVNERLRAGAWTRISIDLTPCSSDELGFLEFSMKTPTAALN